MTVRCAAVDVARPPPDDPELCGLQKIVRWPLASGVDLERWRREFDELMLQVGGRFAQVEPRQADGGVRAGPAGRAAAGELLDDRRARRGAVPAGRCSGCCRPAAWDEAGVR